MRNNMLDITLRYNINMHLYFLQSVLLTREISFGINSFRKIMQRIKREDKIEE